MLVAIGTPEALERLESAVSAAGGAELVSAAGAWSCASRSRQPRRRSAAATARRPPRPASSAPSARARVTTRPTWRCCWRRRWGRRRGRSPSGSGPRSADSLGDELTGWEVAGPGFLNLTLSDGWYRRATARRCSRRARSSVPAAPTRPSGCWSSSCRPTRPARWSPPAVSTRHTATRWPRSSPTTATPCAASTTSTTPAVRSVCWASRCRPGRAARRCPRGATRASTCASSRPQIPDVESLSVEEAAAAAVEILLDADQGDARALRRPLRPVLQRADPARGLAELYRARARDRSSRAGNSYRSEGALWLRTTSFGDDKDRVLERSDGAPTYLAADLGYLLEKRERGVERQLIPVGADHHGYVARMKAALRGAGRRSGPARDADPPVRAPDRGQRARGDVQAPRRVHHARRRCSTRSASTRRGSSCSSARTTGRSTSTSTWRERESAENPVYYIQYAHARIVTMLGKLRGGACRGRAGARRGLGRRRARPGRAGAGQGAGRVPRRGRRGGRAARPAPDRRLRARAGPGVHRLLPRLQGGRGPAGGGRVVPDRAVAERAADDRAGARAARASARRTRCSGAAAPRSGLARLAQAGGRGPRRAGARRRGRAPVRRSSGERRGAAAFAAASAGS